MSETAQRRPAIVVVDDEPVVLAAVARDLRRGFGERYRIVRARSGEEALEALRELVRRGEQVALLVADQRMPGLSGTDYLVRAREIVPTAKRVLLTAYADTEAAIQAINEVSLDYYLLKPWDPPEEQLFPAVEDLLSSWEAGAALESGGVRLIGHRFSRATHDLRDFLARNRVPARWLDVEREGEARQLLKVAGVDEDRLPVALMEDGAVLERPTILELAERLGIAGQPASEHYDLVIVGGGPAGLAAAVYGASEGLKTIMVESEAPGGQAGQSSRIENYLGFPAGLSGSDLARRAVAQARKFGVEILAPQEVTKLRVEGPAKYVMLSDGTEIGAKAMVIATGVSYRKLAVPGMERVQGAGVYYGAAMTEAATCKGEEVYIVGGANSAGQAAMFFSQHAGRVIMLVRGKSLEAGMSQYLIDQIRETPNIHVELNSQVVEVFGEERLEAISIQCATSGETQKISTNHLFVFIGAAPRTEWLANVLLREDKGFILTGPDLMPDGKRPAGWPLDRDPWLLEACVPGVFVAGDVRYRSVKRVASGVGEGANAVQFVHQYLSTV